MKIEDGAAPEINADTPPARNKGGRPSNIEQRRRRIAKLVEDLANVDLELAEQALRIMRDGGASASVRVQAGQLLASVKGKIEPPADMRPPKMVSDMDDLDWQQLHKEALEIIAKEDAERAALRAEVARLRGEKPPHVAGERAFVALEAERKDRAPVAPPEVARPIEPEPTPVANLEITAESAVPAERVFRGTLAEIGKAMDRGILPSHNPKRWERKSY